MGGIRERLFISASGKVSSWETDGQLSTLSIHPTFSFLHCVHMSILYVWHLYLYSCPANRFISTILLDSLWNMEWGEERVGWTERISAVQFSQSVVSNSLRHHGLQHARLPCPSPIPRARSNSCPLSRWCHPTISSCLPLPLPPSIFPSIRVFSNESVLCIRWPKYWSFKFSISPSSEYSGLWIFWISNSHIHTWLLEKP